MMQNIQALGYGIVTFAVIIGVGAVLLTRFGTTVAVCEYGTAVDYYNETLNLCHEIADSTNTSTPKGTGYTNVNYLNTQLGTTGLAGWTPAIIAFTIGMLFLGYFMTRGARKV